MRLPAVTLDDRDFQDLVNEARLRIAQSCPEWTEHNVSDPGITLIELFAWMTEMVIYRLNRIPDKLHVALLGAARHRARAADRGHAPTCASGSRRRRRGRLIPPARPRSARSARPASEPVVFQTSEDFTIPAARGRSPTPSSAAAPSRTSAWRRRGAAQRARPAAVRHAAEGRRRALPRLRGAARRLLVRVDVDCSQARGAGVDPEDPPLEWEVSSGEGPGWARGRGARSTRPAASTTAAAWSSCSCRRPHTRDDRRRARARYWLRCRLDRRTRSGAEAATFSHPPEIYSITAAPLGALVPAAHARRRTTRSSARATARRGRPSGCATAGARARGGRGARGARARVETWGAWEPRRGVRRERPRRPPLHARPGQRGVELGPAIRTGDGAWRQYGAVPPKGARLRIGATATAAGGAATSPPAR